MFIVEELIAKVRQMANDNPDNVYRPQPPDGLCFYNGGECSNRSIGCIYGQALRDMGYPVAKDDSTATIQMVLDGMRVHMSSRQRSWLRHVQIKQDAGEPWQRSVDNADKAYPLE